MPKDVKWYKWHRNHWGKLVLISEVFNEDIHKASERLLEAIKNGVLFPKNIAY